eukprot:CAMPEP_0172159428 /NCGR_PEP_ID=MMETSP1050-20130122/4956_1 /TAXON_ID=233186 /ORGANISM="Cryptomonas curvata, Strain CCAP979/52" /LENGTH=41 /DNA_ID= /DNA_START= /DNA_END= /DNA_ORIENTATION=
METSHIYTAERTQKFSSQREFSSSSVDIRLQLRDIIALYAD